MTLAPEALEIRAMAREFAEGEIRPHAAAWDARRELPADIFTKLGELGFLGMGIPEVYGGLDLDLSTALLALEALSWGDASVGLALSVHGGPVVRAILEHGTDDQRQHWLPRMATGETLGAFALSEEDAGSDATALKLKAERVGDEWVLTGRKRWVTNGDRAGLLLVFARTGEERKDISTFLVPRETEGIRQVARERTLGMSASETLSLEFSEARVPASALLGGVGNGWAVAQSCLVVGRLSVAAQALGIAQAAYEHAIRYAREREQFGHALSDFGAIREKLAGMALRIEQSRTLLLDTAGRWERAHDDDAGDEGESAALHLPSSLASAAALSKISASETAMWVSDEAVQIFGGYGYMRDYPVEKLMRDAKGTEIYEGTNEVLRWLVARDLLAEMEGR